MRRSRKFYVVMASLASAVVFVGFAPTYYLKHFFATPQLPLLLHVHGVLMTAWLTMLIVQSALVASHRTQVHRKLGVAGGVLAASIVVVGITVAIWAARAGHAPPGAQPLPFLTVPFGDIAVFAAMVGAALYYRRKPELHKRLMLIGTIAIMPAGIARWPFALAHTPPIFFGVADLILISCAVFDYSRTKKLNPAYLWGGLLLIASHPLRLMLAGTATWMTFAKWVTGA